MSDNTKKIAILMGDGIGPETMAEGIKVLKVIEARNDINFDLVEAPFGATAWFSHGSSFPDETKKLVDEADAVIKGPIGLGHEESKQIPIDEQPERGAFVTNACAHGYLRQLPSCLLTKITWALLPAESRNNW